jgi:hypothetical protein
MIEYEGVFLSYYLKGKPEGNGEVGGIFGITLQAVTNVIRHIEKIIEDDRKFNKEIALIRKAKMYNLGLTPNTHTNANRFF